MAKPFVFSVFHGNIERDPLESISSIIRMHHSALKYYHLIEVDRQIDIMSQVVFAISRCTDLS